MRIKLTYFFSRLASRATTRPRSMDSLADDVSPTPMTSSSKSPLVTSPKSPLVTSSSPTKKNVVRTRVVNQEQAENVAEYASMKRPPQLFVNQVRHIVYDILYFKMKLTMMIMSSCMILPRQIYNKCIPRQAYLKWIL